VALAKNDQTGGGNSFSPSYHLRQLLDGGGVKKARDGQVAARQSANLGNQAGSVKRVAAKLKEVILQSDG
jgi:DNA-binding transcriptional ArsR family regulator